MRSPIRSAWQSHLYISGWFVGFRIKLNEIVTNPVGLQNRAWKFPFTRLLNDLVLVTHTSLPIYPKLFQVFLEGLGLALLQPDFEPGLPSLAVFVSWQCLCKSWRFLYSSFPPLNFGMIWSASITSSSRKNKPQWAHFPFCFFKGYEWVSFCWVLVPNPCLVSKITMIFQVYLGINCHF